MSITQLSTKVAHAKKLTAQAASVKDWRLHRKIDRDARDAAKSLLNGFLIGTADEIKSLFPDICPQDAPAGRQVWAFRATPPDENGGVTIRIIAV